MISVLRSLVAVPVTVLLATAVAFGYSDERVVSPADGERVSARMEFYISASGGPEKEEFYRIEVAADSEFEEILIRFDSRDSKAGWLFGDLLGVDDVPDKYRPVEFEGIHFRSRGHLKDGEYYWRASKAVGGGAWEPIDGEAFFVVDTLPPEPVDSLRLAIDEGGNLVLTWSPVNFDAGGGQEEVGGYRVYQYTRRLKRYPVMTRYMVGETEYAEHLIPGIKEDTRKIVYYRVRAVDAVGNEEGRRRPAPMGSLDAQLHPPNLDQLADPAYLRRLAQEDEQQ